MNQTDPLRVLLEIKNQKDLEIEDSLIEQCYKLQKNHQYDKDRITLKKMEALVEEELVKSQDDKLL